MALEDRIRTSVDQAVQGLVSEILSASQGETAQQVADVESRLKEEFERQVAELRDREQEAVGAVQAAMQSDLDRQLQETRQQAAEQVRLAVAEAESRAAEAASESVAAARVRERELEMAAMTRLVESVRGLDGATSLSEVLDALALAAAREAARAAVVVLKGDRVAGWKLSGFGTRDALPKSIDMPLAEAGIIAQAATGARPVTSRDAPAGDGGPGFEPLSHDRMGMAMPVLFGGKVVAIVYADAVAADGHPRSVPSAWPEVIEVLARHAGRCLEALTAQKAAAGAARVRGAGGGAQQPAATAPAQADSGSSAMRRLDESLEGARRLARLLVAEIRLNHGSAVSQGCRDRNLLARLAPEIERARDTYASRVPDGADSREVFHQELVRTLAGGDASLLGATG